MSVGQVLTYIRWEQSCNILHWVTRSYYYDSKNYCVVRFVCMRLVLKIIFWNFTTCWKCHASAGGVGTKVADTRPQNCFSALFSPTTHYPVQKTFFVFPKFFGTHPLKSQNFLISTVSTWVSIQNMKINYMSTECSI